MSYMHSKLLFYIIFFFLLKLSFTQNIEEIILSLENPYSNNFTNIQNELHITLNLNDSNISSSSNSYLHFSTFPLNSKNPDYQQILFSNSSINNEYPSNKNTPQYSYKFSKNANLITLFPSTNESKKSYLTIKCLKYPCSFNFKASIEKDNANLNLYDEYSFYLYNSNSMKNIDDKFTRIRFKFLPFEESKEENNRKTVTVINPGDKDGIFTKLFFVEKNTEIEMTGNKYKIKVGALYEFPEEDNKDRLYILQIESLENQFITISIKPSKFDTNNNLIISEITPNSIPRFSLIKNEEKTLTECYKINQEYINNFLTNNNNDLLYASIEYFSLPIETYLKYSSSKKNIEINKDINSLNIIINKESNEYPQICFEPSIKNSENSLMIQLSHISPNLQNNYDIYYPLYSGFEYTKTLLPGSLGVYSHISDIHYIEKIYFYLRHIKNRPEMYVYHCDDYPSCVNYIDINNLSKLTNAEKASNYDDFQFYSKKYNNKIKDLSPDGYEQNLLLVYCPKSENNFCQFSLQIFSDLDEIILEKNKNFYGIATKDDNYQFKLTIKQFDENFKHCEFCINATNDDLFFDTLNDLNNATIKEIIKNNRKCYRYQVDKIYNDLQKKDIEIIFNIKANKDINFILTNEVVQNFEMGKIKYINNFNFPYELDLELGNITNFDKDLLFNIYLNNQNDENVILDNIQIGAIIINQSLLNEIEEKNNIDIFNNNPNKALIQKLDKGTRSALININKNFINKGLGGGSESYFLHFLFYENNSKNIINQEFSAKIFTLAKKNNQYDLEQNTFLSDVINLDNKDVINLYHLNAEKNKKLEIKFSSNYPINNFFSIYFLPYDQKANIDLDYCKNNALNYNKSQNGEMYTFTLNEMDNIESITLAVVSTLKKEETNLQKLNYIFKYNIYDKSEYDVQTQYDYNDKYNITEAKDKITFQISAIKKKSEKNYPKSEVNIRKIDINKSIKNESFDTFAIIESDYDLIKGTKSESNDKINIKIDKSDYVDGLAYSIIVDIFDENEKFVISKLDKKEKDQENNPEGDGDNDKTELLLKILIPVGIVLIVGIIILIIVCLKKSSGGELKESIMKTSFQDDAGLIKDNNEEIVDENILT